MKHSIQICTQDKENMKKKNTDNNPAVARCLLIASTLQ